MPISRAISRATSCTSGHAFGRTFPLLILLAAILVMGLAGCFSEDQNEPITEPQTWLPPRDPQDTADDVVAEFMYAYTNRDLAAYSEILHPDFFFKYVRGWDQMPFEPRTQYLDRETDLAITANIFSGEPIQNHIGETVPGIEQIIWHTCNPTGPWVHNGEWRPTTTYKRPYTIRMEIRTSAGNSLFLKGYHLFEVARIQSTQDGQVQKIWQIQSQEDLLNCDDSDPSCVTWAELKLMYRE